MTNHRVEQGETLASIAAAYGFPKPDPIWAAPENRELRARRKNPQVLMPGDLVVIPEKKLKRVRVETEQSHKFVVATPSLSLRLRVRDPLGEPLAGVPYEARIGGRKVRGSTDANGGLELKLLPSDRHVDLLAKGIVHSLSVGALDPEISRAGVTARLQNLGYLPSMKEYDEGALRLAIALFADEQKLDLASLKYEELCAKLEEAHGS